MISVVKGLLAGVAAVIVYVLLAVAAMWLRTPAEGVGFAVIPMRPILIGALLVFAAAFYWAFKRARRPRGVRGTS